MILCYIWNYIKPLKAHIFSGLIWYCSAFTHLHLGFTDLCIITASFHHCHIEGYVENDEITWNVSDNFYYKIILNLVLSYFLTFKLLSFWRKSQFSKNIIFLILFLILQTFLSFPKFYLSQMQIWQNLSVNF